MLCSMVKVMVMVCHMHWVKGGCPSESTKSMRSPQRVPHGIHCISDSTSRLYMDSTWTPHRVNVLRTIFLQVPTIPNPVRVVGVVRMSEFQTWCGKVEGDDVASAYVLHPLWTSFVSIYKESSRIDLR